MLATGPTPEKVTAEGIRPPEIRIIRITYRSGVRRRVVSALAKIPYGGMFALMAVLARAVAMGDIRWFRIDTPPTITAQEREVLLRWPEALASTSEASGVSWLA